MSSSFIRLDEEVKERMFSFDEDPELLDMISGVGFGLGLIFQLCDYKYLYSIILH